MVYECPFLRNLFNFNEARDPEYVSSSPSTGWGTGTDTPSKGETMILCTKKIVCLEFVGTHFHNNGKNVRHGFWTAKPKLGPQNVLFDYFMALCPFLRRSRVSEFAIFWLKSDYLRGGGQFQFPTL